MINTLFFFANVGDSCKPTGGSFLGFPTWYTYLHGIVAYAPGTDTSKVSPPTICTPSIQGINDTWLIVAAVIEILLRIAAIAAVLVIIYGAFDYVTSQGEPDATGRAKGTIINALIGLAITVAAASVVAFIAGSIT